MKSTFEKIRSNRNFGLIVGLIVLLILAAILTPGMFSRSSFLSMLRNYASYGLLAAGMMLVILTGGIDLSIGATLSLVGVICTFGQVAHPEIPGPVWMLIAMLIGCVCGALNGFLIGYLKIVPMIATLGTMYIYRGFSFLLSNGEWIFPQQFSESYTNTAMGMSAGIYNILWILIVVFVILGIFLSYTTGGRRIYAIGSNESSAVIAGVNVRRVRLSAYVIEGLLAGLAGMLYTANYAICYYGMGEGYEMTAIAICILGGVSIKGGRGKMDSVVLAFLMMSIITYFISLLPGLSVWQNVIQAIIIIASVTLNNYLQKNLEKAALKRKGDLM